MSNVFQRSLVSIADRRFSEEPQVLLDTWQIRQHLCRHHFDRGWVDAIVQTYDGSYGLYDAYGFALVWSALVQGKICYAICDIDQTCSSDRDIDTNRGILSALTKLKGPAGAIVRCEADFYGGLSDSDGYFRWFDPLRFQHASRQERATAS
jgi:hypothetical protein